MKKVSIIAILSYKVSLLLHFHRVKDIKARGLFVIDIDGGCLARKWQRFSDKGLNLEPLPVPKQPMTGWKLLDEEKADSITCKIPKISHGTMYQYLSSGAGRVRDVEGTTFRVLYKGYNHWASGRVDKIEINTQNPFYCCFFSVLGHSIYEARAI
jgi:hypothetical protein